jgi:selenium metabolism protein YedF
MQGNTLIQVTQNGMGTGSEELGLQLITNYFKLLDADGRTPKIIVFYNGGIKLICKNSPALEALQNLSKKGVKLVVCKTCLNHFDLLDQMEVGTVGSMPDIITLQANADKIINL